MYLLSREGESPSVSFTSLFLPSFHQFLHLFSHKIIFSPTLHSVACPPASIFPHLTSQILYFHSHQLYFLTVCPICLAESQASSRLLYCNIHLNCLNLMGQKGLQVSLLFPPRGLMGASQLACNVLCYSEESLQLGKE